jgi:hypothetical protein
MTVFRDPDESIVTPLDDDAHRLLISWKKLNSYAASFAKLWYDTKKRFDVGEFPGWDFDFWVLTRAHLSVEYPTKLMSSFQRSIAGELREQATREKYRQQAQRSRDRAAKKLEAQRQREAARQLREVKRREIEQRKTAAATVRATKLAAKLSLKREREAALEAKRKREKPIDPIVAARHPGAAPIPAGLKLRTQKREGETPAEAALRQSAKGGKWTKGDTIKARQRHAERKAALIGKAPEDELCAKLLQECGDIENQYTSRRVALGERYYKIRERVKAKQAGSDEQHCPWSWTGWVKCYIVENSDPLIQQSLRTVFRCIEDYEKTLTDCHFLPADNVLKLRPKAS